MRSEQDGDIVPFVRQRRLDMRLEGKINLVIHGLIALGTNGAVVVAIWGNWFRSKFMPPKLILTAHTLERDPARFGSGTWVMFYHLRVINRQDWLPASKCRVMLRGLSRRDPSGYISTCGAVRLAAICMGTS